MKTTLKVVLSIEYDHCDPADMLGATMLIVDTIAFLNSTCALTIASDDYGIVAEPESIDLTISRVNLNSRETRLAERTFTNRKETAGVSGQENVPASHNW